MKTFQERYKSIYFFKGVVLTIIGLVLAAVDLGGWTYTTAQIRLQITHHFYTEVNPNSLVQNSCLKV